MKRRGYSRETIETLRHAFHLLLAAKLNTSQALEKIQQELSGSEEVQYLVQFIEASQRGVIK